MSKWITKVIDNADLCLRSRLKTIRESQIFNIGIIWWKHKMIYRKKLQLFKQFVRKTIEGRQIIIIHPRTFCQKIFSSQFMKRVSEHKNDYFFLQPLTMEFFLNTWSQYNFLQNWLKNLVFLHFNFF